METVRFLEGVHLVVVETKVSTGLFYDGSDPTVVRLKNT